MRLYSITSALLLCLSTALLCASQDTADAITHLRPPLNGNDSLSPDIGRRRFLFSRTNGEGKPKPIKGPVQTAWEERGRILAEGGFGTVWMLTNGFLVVDRKSDGGHKRVPAVIKEVPIESKLDEKWVWLELVYLENVDQLFGYGHDKHKKAYYIVMPYMGMKWSKALKEGIPVKEEAEVQQLGDQLAAVYENQFGVKHLDVNPGNVVFQKQTNPGERKGDTKQDTPTKWDVHLIDWGYAMFKSQPEKPKFQKFSEEC
ncbi:hypothetical protein APHAL10511_000326 [Amanita phalloides]|nr:hypothetical protein APHAL10511_000326 [Amanita phalloides]